jgi:hypothetical protein
MLAKMWARQPAAASSLHLLRTNSHYARRLPLLAHAVRTLLGSAPPSPSRRQNEWIDWIRSSPDAGPLQAPGGFITAGFVLPVLFAAPSSGPHLANWSQRHYLCRRLPRLLLRRHPLLPTDLAARSFCCSGRLWPAAAGRRAHVPKVPAEGSLHVRVQERACIRQPPHPHAAAAQPPSASRGRTAA